MFTRLFEPYSLGPHKLRNRMVMAPMTRSRSAQPGNLPTGLNALYYRQRAGAGLIISEATQISQQGQGYAFTPGIHNAAQVAGWRKVTDAVHEEGGLIFLQLWHVGRISHPALQPQGGLPVAPSALKPTGMAFIVNERGKPGLAPFVTPRALSTEELPGIVAQYAEASRHALTAGFDGVEIHAANGYLLDQFLNSTTNLRTDAYGGSIDNRLRLLMEVTEAVCGIWGPDRVGVRLSPLGTFNDIGDEDPEALFSRVAERLSEVRPVYLHLVDATYVNGNKTRDVAEPRAMALVKQIRQCWSGTLIVCGCYDRDRAEAAIDQGIADLVGFGRPFIANPDLTERYRHNASLASPVESLFYGGGAHGYVDYPSLGQERGEVPMTDLDSLEVLSAN